MTTLNKIALFPSHVVTQIVETKLVVCAVSNICVVLLPALWRLLICNNASNAHAKEPVNTTHKLTLIASKIVVNSNNMNALTFQSVQIARQCCNKCFTFTSLHFCNIAPMQCCTAHELNVKMTLTKSTP
ncbi:Uncharacterised protein [Chlamydia trachomatis]|nr:Uncharacterised protein [Chlamydia trachomatis]